jgi:hypothetical protein
MSPLQAPPLSAYQEIRVKVNRGGLIRVQNNSYSVPTSLIGYQVRVHIYEWHLEVRYGHKMVETIPRLVGQNKEQINYRHLIGSLLRKPGGFRNYRHREAFFPGLVFRQAWEQLQKWHSPRKADLTYLRVLNLAAKNQECEVAAALKTLLARGNRWDETDVEPFLQRPQPVIVPSLQPAQIDLSCYDRLLQEVV